MSAIIPINTAKNRIIPTFQKAFAFFNSMKWKTTNKNLIPEKTKIARAAVFWTLNWDRKAVIIVSTRSIPNIKDNCFFMAKKLNKW